MNNFRKLKIGLFCVGLFCLTGLCVSCTKTDEAESKRPLQVAFQNRIGSAIPIVSVEKGYFQKEGITVRALRFNSGPACAEALYSGSVDVGAMGDSTAIMALVRHGKLKLIASHSSGEHRHRLIVRQDGTMPIRLTQVGALGYDILHMSDYPRTTLGLKHLFPDETACARHLERIRWP